MEENFLSPFLVEGRITNIRFGVSTLEEISTSSLSGFAISHPGQLSNPYLGLPLPSKLASGRCDSCGTTENEKCEGHFGYIQLPLPIYHPRHLSEVKRILSLLCLKCLRLTKGKALNCQNRKTSTTICSYCESMPRISIKEEKTPDGAVYLELKVPPKSKLHDGSWKFLDKYGYHVRGDSRPLLPYEALQILKDIPDETRKRLAAKGYYPHSGLIMQCLPVPPNCLSVPNITDGVSITSSDLTINMLRKVLNKIETIKGSRSGLPNFQSHEIEANELQLVVAKYMDLRGTTQVPHNKKDFVVGGEVDRISSKVWLEKMRNLFIRKGSSSSSRSVITGDAFRGIHEIGLPKGIAERITFEEKVTTQNIAWLQKMVDENRCVTFRDGSSMYAFRVGLKAGTSLKVGQILNRPVVDGDIVFINRPPTTHKHSLQALSVYTHEDNTVKINPLICAPLGADFDGDCVHIFYPQCLSAKAEAQELFTVENQLLSSHTGVLNFQFVNDSMLALKLFFRKFFLKKAAAQQLVMSTVPFLYEAALIKAFNSGPQWTVLQILQTTLPADFDCSAKRLLIQCSELLAVDYSGDSLQALFTEITTSVIKMKGPEEAVRFLNFLQPMLMEILFSEGYSITLEDFIVPSDMLEVIRKNIEYVSGKLCHSEYGYNGGLESDLKKISLPLVDFFLRSPSLGNIIDSESKSSISKLVEQLGFLGLQLYGRGKFYSRSLVEKIVSYFKCKYSVDKIPSEAFGLVKNSFFRGLNPHEELSHVIAARETLIRSSRGLTEPGILFKKLMAVLRDIVICYDGTVRNICTNSIILFKYGMASGNSPGSMPQAGEPVGVLAATAVSNPAYKAVLDSSQSNTSSWQLMKEILLCRTKFISSNNLNERRVILFLNDCPCGKKYCREKAAYMVQNHLRKVILKDLASEFFIEYKKQLNPESSGTNAGLVGHIHLDKNKLMTLHCDLNKIHQSCQDAVNYCSSNRKKFSQLFKRIRIMNSGSCTIQQSHDGEWCPVPCLCFYYEDETGGSSINEIQEIMADIVCPVVLDTVIKGDPRINGVNIIWTDLDSASWIRKDEKLLKGEIALELVIAKQAVKDNNDAWRVAMDSCLPVMHFVDTTRSFPYGIKQIQELYGISCAFEEAVQRLFTSINSVSKGVLKEHLILVASCMSCTGNLIGFNTGGYKALLRSLKVQVPFTEATVFTPMKCFEKAAEKCHVDYLSSIVASCAWGKKVTVGTGTPFEILWDKQVISNQEIEVDALDFLQLIKSTTSEKIGTDCLFDGDDDLLGENENRTSNLSPEQDLDFAEPIFEDNTVSQSNISNPYENGKDHHSNWQPHAGSAVKSSESGWNSWKMDTEKDNTTDFNHSNYEGGRETRVHNSIDSSADWSNGQDICKLGGTALEDQSNSCGEWKVDDSENASNANTVWTSAGESIPLSNNYHDAGGSWDRAESQKESTTSLSKCGDGWGRTVGSYNESITESNVWGSDSRCRASIPPSPKNLHSATSWNCEETQKESTTFPSKAIITSSTWDANSRQSPSIAPIPSPKGDGWADDGIKKIESRGWNENKKSDDGNMSCDWGSSSEGAWENWNNHNQKDLYRQSRSPIPSMKLDNARSASGHLTATRRRMDQFSSEEIEILNDVDPTIIAVKNIMQSYSNGDKLSADDQVYILEKVFNFHPDKSAKMGPNFDCLMVDEAHSHRGSRCFYLVSSDETREDFSYLKCMRNYIEVKYAQKAQSFIRKYFRPQDSARPPQDASGP